MVQAQQASPFQVINAMVDFARAQGASVLRVEGALANARLLDILVRRYGAITEGGIEYFLIPIK